MHSHTQEHNQKTLSLHIQENRRRLSRQCRKNSCKHFMYHFIKQHNTRNKRSTQEPTRERCQSHHTTKRKRRSLLPQYRTYNHNFRSHQRRKANSTSLYKRPSLTTFSPYHTKRRTPTFKTNRMFRSFTQQGPRLPRLQQPQQTSNHLHLSSTHHQASSFKTSQP